jgi:hypothetical protein
MEKYTKPEMVSLKAHPELDEKWVQSIIANDPSILGLGNLSLKDQERIQPRAGRLDLLLQDVETKRRYEVELQLGQTDEAHIIRTIEYWDIERKRYPQYDHCAVIIAEDVTSRFLNVISLFNGAVPLIAIQIRALRLGGVITLLFTTVVDEVSRGLVDEDEDEEAAPATRADWESRTSKEIVGLADDLLGLIKDHESSLSLKYNQAHIGVAKNGHAFNFVSFYPKQKFLKMAVRLPKTAEWDEKIGQAGLDALDYARWGAYQLRLTKADVSNQAKLLEEMMLAALAQRSA